MEESIKESFANKIFIAAAIMVLIFVFSAGIRMTHFLLSNQTTIALEEGQYIEYADNVFKVISIFDDKEYVHYTTDCINEADLDAIAFNMGVYRPHWGFDTFENILNNCKKVMFEGYMVYSPSTTIKLKSPYYSSLKAIARSPDLNKFNRGRLSPEFIKIFDELDLNKFQDLDEQERLKILKQDYNEKILHIR